jgi:hypothetical protein
MAADPSFPFKTYMQIEKPILETKNPNVTKIIEHK